MNDTGTDSGFAGQTKNQDPSKQRRGARGGPRGVWLAITFIVAAVVVTVSIIQGAYHRSSGNVPDLPEPRKVASAPAPAELLISFLEVAKSVKPSVVFRNLF